MRKCKVIDLFEVSWGTVAVLDFFEPTYFKVGDKLKSSNGLLWMITRVTRGKAIDKSLENLIDSLYVWDCNIKPINHLQTPSIGEELYLVKE